MAVHAETARIIYVSRRGHPRRDGGKFGAPEKTKKLGEEDFSGLGKSTLTVTPSEVPFLDRTDGGKKPHPVLIGEE